MQKGKGIITVIHGPMFSGKTEELLRRIRRAKIAKKKTQLFKPRKDERYHREKVVPHYLAHKNQNHLGESAIAVDSPLEIQEKLAVGVNLVGIEEGQFFDYSLFYLVKNLSRQGIDTVISLLDQDFRRMPFPIENSNRNSGDYLALAHNSIKLAAICVKCGDEAQCTQKLIYAGTYAKGNPIYVPASFYDEIVVVGTNLENTQKKKNQPPQQIYEARCLDCHEIPDEPVFELTEATTDVESTDRDQNRPDKTA